MVRPRGRARVKTYLRMEGLLSTPLLLAGKVDSLSIIKRKTDLCVPENQSTKLQGKFMNGFRARSKTSSKIIKNHCFSEPFKSPQPLNPRGEQVDRSALHVRHGVYYTYDSIDKKDGHLFAKLKSKIIKNRARKFTIPYSLLEKQQKIQGS